MHDRNTKVRKTRPTEDGEIVRAVEGERQRIAAELHDGLYQELIAISFVAKGLQGMLEKQGNPLASEMTTISKSVAQAAAHTRQVAHGVSPYVGPGKGLVEALRELAGKVEERHPIRCLFKCGSPVSIPGPEVSLQLYLIAQEAVYNAVTHSGGTEIQVELGREGAKLHVAVRDDGCGLSPEAMERPGFGLRTVKYRAGLIQAELTVRNRESGGTEVICRVCRAMD